MAVEAKLQQRLTQSLVLTPQLQQSLKMLQMGHDEYLENLSQELLENPVLEEAAPVQEEVEAVEPPHLATDDDVPPDLSEIDFSLTALERPNATGNGQGGEAMSIDSLAPVPEGLSSHLMMQLRTTELPSAELGIAGHIVGNLNRDGYLECTASEIAESAGCEVAQAEYVLGVVQLLDPPGIAARNLTECMLIQLDQLGHRDTLAWRVVEQHCALLEERKHEQIAKLEGVTLQKLLEVLAVIRRLEPRPGRPFLDEPSIFITPDVYVRKIGDEFVVTLNESGIPNLRLNPQYRELLAKGGRGDKQYLQERARAASWLLKNIQLRQQTILKVSRSIVQYQSEFFEQGVRGLRPLVLREVADDVHLHESTVSRVTSNKYMHTPHGVFELKFFFRAGIQSKEGEISSEAVKEKIRSLVEGENRARPLSDQEIAVQLHGGGIDIARRTIAKYREAMNILPSSQRKRFY